MDIAALVRENIRSLKPYSSARDEYTGNADVYLDANENPYPNGFNRYPDPHQQALKTKISVLKNCNANQIFLGNGSDEAIDLIIRAFCEPGKDSILITEPTYGMYAVCAQINNVGIKRVLLSKDFDVDTDAILNNLTSDVKVIFLCSPNNPSGNLLSKEKITSLLKTFNGILVLDEAYIDFSNDKGLLPQLNAFPNLLILQTFSKAWGLAGLRLGMCFGSEYCIKILSRIKYPYNINSHTQALALKYLDQVDAKNEQVTAIIRERNLLTESLQKLPSVRYIYPSDANFLLVRFAHASDIFNTLMKQGIIVRDRSNVVLCDDCLRITIGTPQENITLLKALQQL